MKRNINIVDKISNALEKNNIFEAERIFSEINDSDLSTDEKSTLVDNVKMMYRSLAANN